MTGPSYRPWTGRREPGRETALPSKEANKPLQTLRWFSGPDFFRDHEISQATSVEMCGALVGVRERRTDRDDCLKRLSPSNPFPLGALRIPLNSAKRFNPNNAPGARRILTALEKQSILIVPGRLCVIFGELGKNQIRFPGGNSLRPSVGSSPKTLEMRELFSLPTAPP